MSSHNDGVDTGKPGVVSHDKDLLFSLTTLSRAVDLGIVNDFWFVFPAEKK